MKLLSVCIAVGVLMLPVYLLFLVQMDRGYMAVIITVFLVLFTALITFMTGAKLEKIFVGTAT